MSELPKEYQILIRLIRKGEIEVALKSLTEREAKVLKMRFGLDGKEHTLKEIGRWFKVGRERIRQIEAKALRKLYSRFGTRKEKEIIKKRFLGMLNKVHIECRPLMDEVDRVNLLYRLVSLRLDLKRKIEEIEKRKRLDEKPF